MKKLIKYIKRKINEGTFYSRNITVLFAKEEYILEFEPYFCY